MLARISPRVGVPLLLAAYAAMTAWFRNDTTLAAHATWARLALPAYLVAVAMSVFPRTRSHAMLVAFVGSCLVPLAWMTATGLAQPEVGVLVDGALQGLASGTPYLSHPARVDEARPYLPLLFAFGLPRAFGVPGVLGDPRLWILGVGGAFLWYLRRVSPERGPGGRRTLALLAFPVMSLNLSVSAIDIPIVVLLGLALVEVSRGRLGAAGVATAGALLMKPTATLVFLIVLIGVVRARSAGWPRYLGWSLGPALLVVAVVAAVDPQGFVFNALRFPLGLTEIASPAQSPFPGVLLARSETGRWVAIGLVVLAVVGSLGYAWVRPAPWPRAWASRSAVLLTFVILLAPNSRVGYFIVPIALWAVAPRLGSGLSKLAGPPRPQELFDHKQGQ